MCDLLIYYFVGCWIW